MELLVALALFGIVGAAALRALDRQARFHTGILAILESRAQHAAAHEALAVELRGTSVAASDIGPLTDSSVVFRMPVGAGLACDITNTFIDLGPDSANSGQHFARFRTSPQAGDTAWVFDEGATDSASDDAWRGLAVTAVSRATGHCVAGSPWLDPVLDAGRPSWRLAIGVAPPPTVTAGAPVRLTRRARFALYRGGTGEHWLGFTEADPVSGAWITIQPVSGPYLSYAPAAPSASGIALSGRDSSGIVSFVTPSTITVATRTRTTRAVRMDGVARGPYADSLHSLIGLRNAK